MHYMTVLVIEYESTAYQQYKMAKKKLGVFLQFFAREATLIENYMIMYIIYFPCNKPSYIYIIFLYC